MCFCVSNTQFVHCYSFFSLFFLLPCLCFNSLIQQTTSFVATFNKSISSHSHTLFFVIKFNVITDALQCTFKGVINECVGFININNCTYFVIIIVGVVVVVSYISFSLKYKQKCSSRQNNPFKKHKRKYLGEVWKYYDFKKLISSSQFYCFFFFLLRCYCYYFCKINEKKQTKRNKNNGFY